MVISAALLIRERGAHPTAIADVLEHSGAPRGSAYHYFPGGRTQLLCEAIDYAGEYIAARIADAKSGLDVLDDLISHYRRQLVRSEYRAGCPVVAVAVEAGDPDKPDQATPVIDRAAAAFARWTDLIAQHRDRGRDRRRPRLPRSQTPRPCPRPVARSAAGRVV
jgi:AcrR family transcriptional regulator